MSERLQGAEIESKDAFLFLARRFLETVSRGAVDEDARADDSLDPEKSLYTVLYHKCPLTLDATSTAVDPKVTVDSEVKSSTRFRDLVEALKTLGFSAAQAKRRLERVWESFGARMSEISDEQIVKSALRIRAA